MNESDRIDELLAEMDRLRARVAVLEQPRAGRRLRFGGRGQSWIAAFAGLLAAPMVAWAVDVPFTFVNGALADASQVNANFNALVQAFNTHVGDTTIHHPQLTSIQGLTGGTITGDVTVTGKVNVSTVEGTPLRLQSATTIDVVGGTVARMTAPAQVQIQAAQVRLN